MFWGFIEPYKKLWSMEKNPKYYDRQPTDPLPPGLTAVKDLIFFTPTPIIALSQDSDYEVCLPKLSR